MTRTPDDDGLARAVVAAAIILTLTALALLVTGGTR